MGSEYHLRVNIQKMASIPFKFLFSVIEIMRITKRTKFTVKEFIKYLNLSRKTVDKYLKSLVEKNIMHIETLYSPEDRSTRKINHYTIKEELLKPLIDLRKSLQPL
jgi:DNA-binding MarR family transcriptional regulator